MASKRKKSTETALLDIKEKILDNFEHKLLTIGIFLDFKKAFDSVKHHILLRKLPSYGIRGKALELIKSYLSNRQQYTSLGDTKSNVGNIICGVPQGSILGPLLFLIHINDLPNIPLTPDVVLYADDTNIFFAGNSLSHLEQQANLWLTHLSEWLKCDRLELNTKKTKYVLFRPRNKAIASEPTITFEGQKIERVTAHKFLGVLFQEHLDWSLHTNHVRTKISRSTGIICKLRQLLPLWLKKQLYYSIVHSHLHYCLLVWGNTTKANTDKILILQKKAIRLISGVSFRHHTAPLFKEHNILTVTNVMKQKLAMLIYKQVRTDRSGFYQRHLPRDHSHNLRHRMYTYEKPRTNYGTQKLLYQISHFLNEQPIVASLIDNTVSYGIFKKKIQEHFLSTQT